MAFEPERITSDHITQAVVKIKLQNIKLRASNGYDVIIDGEKYPPKEIMRYAHEAMNGSREWYPGGGEDTNKYLKSLGFQVVSKASSRDYLPEEFDDWFPLTQEYCLDLWSREYTANTIYTYGLSINEQLSEFIQGDKINSEDVSQFSKTGFERLQMAMKYSFTGVYTFQNFINAKMNRNYWALGFNSNPQDLKSFKENNNWFALHYERSDNSQGARIAYRHFDQIKVDDYVIIKGYGGKGDLKVHYAGMVKKKDTRRKVLEFHQRDIDLFNGKAPTGGGAGNWQGTIVPVSRYEDIRQLFFTEPVIHSESTGETLPEKQLTNIKPMNLIFYGPPGTGKTYSTKACALSLINAGTLTERDYWLLAENRSDCLNVWNELRGEGRIEFVTFHQSFAYEDFVQGIRPDVDGSESLRFKKVDGIFKVISDRARKNYENSLGELKDRRTSFDYVFQNFMNDLVQEEKQEIKIQMRTKSYSFVITRYDPDEGRIKFRKQSGGTGHDLLVSNLRKIYEGTLDYGNEGLGVYYNPFVERLREFAQELDEQKEPEERKEFVLVIDEINRANISRVLGELITLLEADKRLGQPDELVVKLPSGESFAVPPNLHLIGTMNTADKSIAHLDIALRRRFKFEPMYPNSDLVKDLTKKGVMERINSVISQNGDYDLTIGHSFFMKDDSIDSILEQSIIPLLSEYYANQPDRVIEILRDAGLTYVSNKFGLIEKGQKDLQITDD